MTSLVSHLNQKYLFIMKPLNHLVNWSHCFSGINFLVMCSPHEDTRKRVILFPPPESRDIKVYEMETCGPSPYKFSIELPLG